MHKHFKRLGLAFAISLASLTGTLAWYYLGQPQRHASDGKDAVARLTESTDEVQRKETTRVIWENVSLNDDLFTGEAIRTSPKASAKVTLKSGAVIQLEPDSLVVLEQNANGLSLDFLEGNLFIQGGDKAAQDGITLKTGNGEIKVGGADVSLSRGKSGDVDLEVHRGELQLNQNGKTVALGKDKAATLSESGVNEKRDQLKLLSPHANETVLLNLARGEKFEVSWTPLPAGYKVWVDAGPSRGALTRQSVEAVDGVTGKIAFSLKPGRWYIRLIAKAEGDQPELLSFITPVTLAPRSAPALIEPTADTPILRAEKAKPIDFRWLDRNPFEAQVLEIAADEKFSNVIRRENLKGDETSRAVALDDGTYFWRVTGFAKQQGLSSEIAHVRILAAADDHAVLTAPANKARVSSSEVAAKGVTFKWQAATTKALTLHVRNSEDKEVFKTDSADGFARATDLKPGVYRWTVGHDDQRSAPFEFTVVETPRLEFLTKEETYEFTTDAPSLSLEWQSVDAASYQYRVSPAGEKMDDVAWTPVRSTKFRTAVSAEGAYKVVINALDAKGTVIAATEERTIVVKRRPTLPAPKWPGSVSSFKSDGGGNVNVSWEGVDGAKGYLLLLDDGKGHREEKQFERGPASLKRMKPGQYSIQVKTVDEYARPGEASAVRPLDVPNSSDIRAPRIKAMKVK